MHDIYCFGHVSTGKIHRIAGKFPQANGYGEVTQTLQNYSGEATGAALVLARLGLKVKLCGNWIGDNQQGRQTIEFLKSRQIDVSELKIQSGYEGVNEIVISDGKTRTVFGRYIDLLFGSKQWEDPKEEDVAETKIVIVDASFGETAEKVGEYAALHKKPLITSDVHPSSPLFKQAKVVVQSEEFLNREFQELDWEGLFTEMVLKTNGWLVFTFGENEFMVGNKLFPEPRRIRPFAIDPIDTAGAGDSFRGALAYGLLQEWDMGECFDFAKALAALVCMSTPGCCDSPLLEDVEKFRELHRFLHE